MSSHQQVIIFDNVRSFHNVGSIIRTGEALGVTEYIACGITPHPRVEYDERLPHVILRAERQIRKTALGAEENVTFRYFETAAEAIASLDSETATYGLEQAPDSKDITKQTFKRSWALIVGNEVDGLEPDTMRNCSCIIEIPQVGEKESLNVSVAAGIALYALQNQT